MSQIWSKGGAIDTEILKFTVGQDYLLDQRLVAYDVQASVAHAKTLARGGYLTDSEAEKLIEALGQIGADHHAGKWSIALEEEDAHTALESRLIAALGELGERIHLGRSRNDQVLVALRLYMLEASRTLANLTTKLADSLSAVADANPNLPMPGYTHLQRAMPSSASLWAESFASELRKSTTLFSGADALASLCPLGSAAGYGTPGLTLDRSYTAELLGMLPHEPVTAVQLSRGKAESALAFAAVTVLNDVGRLSSDLCLYNTSEFGFVKLPSSMTTGSSIMPQKRNPDVFELVRGQSAVAQADLLAILSLTAKMPSGYHRDLQLIKEPLFRLIDRTESSLRIMVHACESLHFDAQRCAEALTPELYAAEEAFELVQKEGLTFRAAYRMVGEKYKE